MQGPVRAALPACRGTVVFEPCARYRSQTRLGPPRVRLRSSRQQLRLHVLGGTSWCVVLVLLTLACEKCVACFAFEVL